MGEPRTKTTLTTTQLKQFAADLRACADSVDKLLELAESKGFKTLDVLNYKSGQQGIDKFTKFAGAIHTATMERLMSKSIDPVEGSLADAAERAVPYQKPEPERPKKKGAAKN